MQKWFYQSWPLLHIKHRSSCYEWCCKDEHPPSLPTAVHVDHDYCQPNISIESSNQVNASDSHEQSQQFDLDTLLNRSNGNIFIENTNFNLFNVPGDGNCFFHRISLAFYGHINNTENYRNTICTYVYENWEMFQEMVMLMHMTTVQIHQKSIFKKWLFIMVGLQLLVLKLR